MRCLLGSDAISERKLECGNPLVILGVHISVDAQGARYQPSDDKVTKWQTRLNSHLASGNMRPGEAQKLSGALQWASQSIFKRLGRAMLSPFYAQAKRKRSDMGPELQTAVRWWIDILQLGIRFASHCVTLLLLVTFAIDFIFLSASTTAGCQTPGSLSTSIATQGALPHELLQFCARRASLCAGQTWSQANKCFRIFVEAATDKS